VHVSNYSVKSKTATNNMFVFLLQLSLVLLNQACMGQDVAQMESTKDRRNWGIVMHKIGSVLNGVSEYGHTFELDIPSLELPVMTTLDCQSPGMKYVYCLEANVLVGKVNRLYGAEFERSKASLTNVMLALGYGGGGGGGGDGEGWNSTDRRRRKRSVKDYRTNNEGCDTDRIGKEEDGLIPWIATALTDATRQPTFGALGAIDKDICTLSKGSNANAHRVITENDRLASQSKVLAARAKALGHGLTEIATRVLQVQAAIRKNSAQIDTTLLTVDKRLEIQTKAQASVFELTAALTEFENNAKLDLEYARRFELGVHRLMEGYVPQLLIPPVEVERVLKHVTGSVLSALSQRLFLVHAKPAFYYSIRSTIFAVKNAKLYINLVVPLSPKEGGLLGVYRIDTTHIATDKQHRMSTRIEGLPDMIAVTPDGLYYTELSVAQLASCRGDAVTKVCDTERALLGSNRDSCASALYFDKVKKSKELCKVTMEREPSPTRVVSISPRRYLVHEDEWENKTWIMWCHEDMVHHARGASTVPTCNTCVITVPCFCSLTGESFTIPYQVEGCVLNENGSSSYPLFGLVNTVSLPVLTALTQPPHHHHYQHLDDVTGTTKLDAVIEGLLKEMNYTVEDNEWAGVLAKGKEYDTDFDKLVVAQKTHAAVYMTREDAYLGSVKDRRLEANADISKIKETYFNAYVQMIVSAKASGWYDIAFGSFSVIVMLMCGYVWLVPVTVHEK